MSQKMGLSRRVATFASWPVGVALTSWSYIWRTTPIHRSETDGTLAEDGPPELPPGVPAKGIQLPEDGSGPLLHRTYTGTIDGSERSAADLIRYVGEDQNRVAPLAMARFRKRSGDEWRIEPGDDYLVQMPGPWDGPVRTVEVTPTSFRFATLDGHLEAGQVEWRAADRDGLVVFQIESWARAGDRLSAVMHDRLLMAKEVQLHMWTSVVERVAERAGGRLAGGVYVETRRVDPSAFSS